MRDRPAPQDLQGLPDISAWMARQALLVLRVPQDRRARQDRPAMRELLALQARLVRRA